MMENESTEAERVVILYNGQEIEVDKAVADYLNEEERKREQAEEKRDKRHLSDKSIDRNDIDDFISDKPADFADRIASNSEAAYLRRKMDESLTATQRRRVKMYFFDRFTYEQIAEFENANVANIWRSIDSAVEKLKTFFE